MIEVRVEDCAGCGEPFEQERKRGRPFTLCVRCRNSARRPVGKPRRRRRQQSPHATNGALAIARETNANKKVGDAAVTYVSQASCPSSCMFLGAGCYAEGGYTFVSVTRHLNANAVGLTGEDVARAEAAAIDAMRVIPGRPMRLHSVGDCSSDEAARIVSAAAARYVERGGGTVWTYTHAWRLVAREAWGAVSVLASCETVADVQLAQARGYATAFTVEGFADDRRYVHGGVEIVPCPAETRHRDCASCRLCFNDQRILADGASIGFSVHGEPQVMRAALRTLARSRVVGEGAR